MKSEHVLLNNMSCDAKKKRRSIIISCKDQEDI